MTQVEHEDVRRFLLGDVSQGVQRTVEERILIEESFLEELSSVEEELIDDYAGGGLSADDRRRFEQHFLCTGERRRRLRFALALARYTSEKGPAETAAASPAGPTLAERLRAFWRGRPLMLRAGVALAAVAVLAGAWWFSFQRTPSQKTFATLSLNISVGGTRGGGGSDPVASVSLPLKEDALKISLVLPEGVARESGYRVELVDVNGTEENLQVIGRDAKSVSVVVPPSRLARGQYALKLYETPPGGEEQRVRGSYFFTAE
jgi:anti-sigma-K factor RskA